MATTMNQSELIDVVSDRLQMHKGDVKEVVDTFLNCVKETVEKDEKVLLVGFGTFTKKLRPSRPIPVANTQELRMSREQYYPHFKASIPWKDALNPAPPPPKKTARKKTAARKPPAKKRAGRRR